METAKGREIKFRAWTGTEMIYEGFHISAPGIAWSWVDFTATDSKALGFPVMQYTGLIDKNGVEIYEGDVMTFPAYYETPEMTLPTYVCAKVIFIHGAFHIQMNDEKITADTNNLAYEMQCYDGDFEVIGNLYQHPELLTPNN